MMKPRVSLIHCPGYDYPSVEAAARRSVDLIGGIGRFVKQGERILIKPNLLSARLPERGVTTHPEVVRAVVRLVKEAGGIPLIGDSPGGAVRGVERVWVETGMKKLAADEGAELVNFETSGAFEAPIDHPRISSVHLTKAVRAADGIINVPKLKTHGYLIYTGAIKNFYGCIPGLRKGEYHKAAPHPGEFGRLLGEIYGHVKDRLRFTLIDGIVGMEGNGPSAGELRNIGMIAAGDDGVALDTVLTDLLGLKPAKIEMITHPASRGWGESDLARIEVSGDPASAFNITDFRFPSNWYLRLIPRFLVRILGKLIWLKAAVVPELCLNCSLCVNSCPVNAIHPVPGGKPVVSAKDCISCLCCHELCPHHAITISTSRLARRFIRQ